MKDCDAVMVWEATKPSIKELESGDSLNRGVQLVPLSNLVRRYNNNIAIRQLESAPNPNNVEKLIELRKKLREKPYEADKMELFKAAYDGLGGDNSEDLSSIFCSELVAKAYQELGLVDPENKPSNEYTPKDFSSEGKIELIENSLFPETFLDYDLTPK